VKRWWKSRKAKQANDARLVCASTSTPTAAPVRGCRGCWSCWTKPSIKATFFFSVGPGQHGPPLVAADQARGSCGRCCAPRPPGCMAGIFCWPAPPGRASRSASDLGHLMRQALAAGHEVGLHAWDHHGWQANTGRWSDAQLVEQIRRGCRHPGRHHSGPRSQCSAAAGWRADERVVQAKEGFGLRYNSDCRGHQPVPPKVLADGSAGRAAGPGGLADVRRGGRARGRVPSRLQFASFLIGSARNRQLNVVHDPR
jgi:undecaprenyl phosphate-alpha-L-ara4FN deformylase